MLIILKVLPFWSHNLVETLGHSYPGTGVSSAWVLQPRPGLEVRVTRLNLGSDTKGPLTVPDEVNLNLITNKDLVENTI